MDTPEIDKFFDAWRGAENGSIIPLNLPDSDDPVSAIIFEPSPQRPAGYETGIFVAVLSETEKLYYLDPEASRERGKLVVKAVTEMPRNGAHTAKGNPVDENLFDEFDYLQKAPDVKRGGGATGEQCSKSKGLLDVG